MYINICVLHLTDAEFDENYTEEVFCLFFHIYYERYFFPENTYNPK